MPTGRVCALPRRCRNATVFGQSTACKWKPVPKNGASISCTEREAPRTVGARPVQALPARVPVLLVRVQVPVLALLVREPVTVPALVLLVLATRNSQPTIAAPSNRHRCPLESGGTLEVAHGIQVPWSSPQEEVKSTGTRTVHAFVLSGLQSRRAKRFEGLKQVRYTWRALLGKRAAYPSARRQRQSFSPQQSDAVENRSSITPTLSGSNVRCISGTFCPRSCATR